MAAIESEPAVLAKCGSRHFGAMLFEGITQVFVTWIKHVLLSELTPNQTVIIDNACFHKSTQVRELIESVGCQLLYLMRIGVSGSMF